MCFECHANVPDTIIINQLNEIVLHSETEFEKITSLSPILQAGIGLNGPDAREIAIMLLKKFINWRYTQPVYYMPTNGTALMDTAHDIKNDLEYIVTYIPNYSDKQTILNDFANYKKLKEPTQCCIQ